MTMINRLITVPVPNADDARRRRLLNILLLGMAIIVAFGLTVQALFNDEPLHVALPVYIGGAVWLGGSVLLWVVNRFWSGRLASVIFLLLLITVIASSDYPEQITNGRGLSLFAVPILVASFVLPPWTSFGAAAVSSAVVSAIALTVLGQEPPWVSLIALFSIALASWLSAQSLERALRASFKSAQELEKALAQVRDLNRDLDRRVRDRTRELAVALMENQAILHSIADGVIVFDTNGKAIVVNPAIAHLLDRPQEAIIGQDIETLMGQDVSEQDQETLHRMLGGSAVETNRMMWGSLTFLVSCAPVRAEGESATGVVAVFHDFSKEAELERLKAMFVSVISHELRTPLNAIMGYADMILAGVYGDIESRLKEAVQRISVNVRQQMSMVNDLLDRAQIEAGTLSLKYSAFRPAELLTEVRSMLEVLATTKGLALQCDLESNMPDMLVGDKRRLQQMMINLTTNAIKYTDRGSVYVKMAYPDPDYWTIQVADTGVGIPADAQEYIFEPFRRVDSSATRKQSGVGLGLSIVKQLAELMGGNIAVHSQVEQGSTFTITLPIAQEVTHE